MSTTGTILLVAVDPAFIGMVSQALNSDGHTVIETGSGPEALTTYARTHPDLVLFDLDLPGIDGLETCRTLVGEYADGNRGGFWRGCDRLSHEDLPTRRDPSAGSIVPPQLRFAETAEGDGGAIEPGQRREEPFHRHGRA